MELQAAARLGIGVGGNTLFFLYVIAPIFRIDANIWIVLGIVCWFELFNLLVLNKVKECVTDESK